MSMRKRKSNSVNAMWKPFTCYSSFNRYIICHNGYIPCEHIYIEISNIPSLSEQLEYMYWFPQS